MRWVLENMIVEKGLDILELKPDGRPDILNAVLTWDEKDVVLFDAGLPGMSDKIKDAVEETGVPFERLNKIIITHQDIDHIGSLSRLANSPGCKIEVFSHIEEKPYIEFEKRPIKLTPERMSLFPDLKAKVDCPLTDGQELPYCGGMLVIHTPGHTPGHICIYLKRYKTLIAGDAMNVADGKLVGPAPQYTSNMQEARASLRKLSALDIKAVICYHGGIYTDNPRKRISELTAM